MWIIALIGQIAIACIVKTEKLTKGMHQAAASVKAFGDQASKASLAMGVAFAGGAATAAAAIYKMISAASSLGDATMASATQFGAASSIIVDEAQRQADAFGVSKRSFIEASTTFGSMLRNSAASSADAAKLGTNLSKLGMDLAAIKGLKTAEAFTAMGAALRGEYDPIERFGIFLKADAIAAKAVSMGLAASAATASDAAKKQATLAAIYEQSSKAQGFFAASALRASNLTESLWGRVENLSAALGQQLLPVASGVLAEINTALSVANSLWYDVGRNALASSLKAIGGMAETASSIGFVQRSIGFVADAWHYVDAVFRGVVANSLMGLAKITRGLVTITKYASMAGGQFSAALGGAGASTLQIYADQIERLGESWQKDFVDRLSRPLPSEGINALFDDARKRTAMLRADLLRTKSDVAFAGAGAISAAAKSASIAAPKVGEQKFAHVIEGNTAEASNAILRARYGGGGDRNRPAEATARNTGEMARQLAALPAAIGVQVGRALGAGIFGGQF
jgi:hypothetical protein